MQTTQTESAPLRAHDMPASVKRGRPAGSINKAKVKGLDLATVLTGVSEPNTEQIVRLPVEDLIPDPENFYSIDGIGELADSIAAVGLLDPIRVRPFEGGKYMIVSGHRRCAAILLIRDGGSEQFKAGVPCIVEYGEASDAMRKLRLIFANSATRQLSSAELSKQAEEVTRLLYELQEQGVRFDGRMRNHVAEACRVSKSKIARLHAIRAQSDDYILDAFDEGKINESVAYTFSRLDRHLQKRIYVNHVRLGYKLEALTAEYVETLGKVYEKLKKTNCKKNRDVWCVSAESRFDYVQMLTHREGVRVNCSRGRCCIGCPDIGECEYACVKCSDERAQAINDRERLKREREADFERRKAAAERAARDHDEECAEIWSRIRTAAEVSGRDLEGVFSQMFDSDGSVELAMSWCAGSEKDTEHFAIDFLDESMIDLADLLSCSVDFLLGRTKEPKLNTGRGSGDPSTPLRSAQDGSEACAQADTSSAAAAVPSPQGEGKETAAWQAGTPEDIGVYAVWSSWGDLAPEYCILYWTGAYWSDFSIKGSKSNETVFAWYKLPSRDRAAEQPEVNEA